MIGVLVTVVYRSDTDDGYRPAITSQHIQFQNMEAVLDAIERMESIYCKENGYEFEWAQFGGVV